MRAQLSMSLVAATWFQPDWYRCLASWQAPVYVVPRMGILDAYQLGYEQCQSDILAFLHDDLLCNEEGWQSRVLAEFADPQVALVGFAGAPGYGHPEMYRKLYHHSSLGRVGFRSNLANAEVHGARFAGECNVACLDGLALIVRRTFLDEIGGWKFPAPVSYFGYSEYLCFSALHRDRKIRMVGVSCDHLGGRSTGLNPNLNPDFEGEHLFLWEHFKDVLPVMVKE